MAEFFLRKKLTRRDLSRFVSHALMLSLSNGCGGVRQGTRAVDAVVRDSVWVREELYFGADIPANGMVTDSLWEAFLEEKVIPQFPDGSTTVSAVGYYRYTSGRTVKEQTRMLTIYYPITLDDGDDRIEAIMAAYKKKFLQESILRATSKSAVHFR